jgi:ribosomal protein L23
MKKIRKRIKKQMPVMGMDIVKKSLLTEKSTMEETENQTITFIVPRNINKTQIKSAIEEFAGCKVKSIRTMNMLGKAKTDRRTNKKIYPKVKKKCRVRVDSLAKVVQKIQTYSSRFMPNQFGGDN